MPLFNPLPLLRLLWANRTSALAALCLGLLWWISRQNAKLAERPAVETHVETKVVTRTVEGPVRYVRRVIERPGGERIVERELTRESLERTVDRETERDRTVAPVGSIGGRRWLLGLGETLPRGADPRSKLTIYGGRFWGNFGLVGHANPWAQGWEPGLALAISF